MYYAKKNLLLNSSPSMILEHFHTNLHIIFRNIAIDTYQSNFLQDTQVS